MKIDKVTGYIKYREEENIFIFDNYELQIIPKTYEKKLENEGTFIFEDLSKPKRQGWINDIQLIGVTEKNEKVIFCIKDCASIKNGIFKYSVKWLYIYKVPAEDQNFLIDGLIFTSQEIEQLFNISRCIIDNYNYNKETKNGNYTLNLDVTKEKIGKFKYKSHDITIYEEINFKKKYFPQQNLDIWPTLLLEFSDGVNDLYKLIEIVILQKHVIDFLTYRSNNTFEKITSYCYNEDHNRIISGYFYFPFDVKIEINKKNINKLIKLTTDLNVEKLYSLIAQDKLYIPYLSSSISERKKYTPQKMLGIFIAFEKIFGWMHSEKNTRGKKYIQMIDETIKLLNQNSQDLISKSNKKYFNEVMKNLEKSKNDINYKSKAEYILNNYKLCSKYIDLIYDKNEEKSIETIATRLNIVRNALAHGSKKLEFQSINLKDMRLIEISIYIMILKYLTMDDEKIVNNISLLFNITPRYND